MSTWIYLVCTDHTPPICAEGESGQHLYDLPQLRRDLAERERIAGMSDGEFDMTYRGLPDRFTANTWQFLRQHPECSIEIQDEYDRVHPIEDPS